MKPIVRQMQDMTVLAMQVWRKFFVNWIAVETGKIRRLEISNAPRAFMPMTTMLAQRIEMTRS